MTVTSVILLPVSFPVSAQAAPESESDVKAAFLYNFIKFTEWPAAEMANKSEPFVIGVSRPQDLFTVAKDADERG